MTNLPDAILFQDVPMQVFDREGVPWLRASQIGLALGYTKGGGQTDTPLVKKAIKRLFERHADEFTEDMTALITVETAGGPQEVRVFSPRGCHLLAMLARTERAKEFRKWVLDVLEHLAGRGPASASMEQLRELVAVWAMLTEMPRAALLSQVLLRFGLAGEEEPAGAVLAAVRFVLEQNDALLCRGRRVSQKSVRLYEAFTNGELFEPELVSAFWKQFDLLNREPGPDGEAPGWLNHSRSPGLLAVNMPQFLRASQTFGLFAFNGAELRRLLRRSYPRKLAAVNKTMRSPHMGKPVKCWVFYLNTSPISDDWGDSPTARGTRPETEPNGEGRA